MATVAQAPKGENSLVARGAAALPAERPSTDALTALLNKLTVNGDPKNFDKLQFETTHSVTPQDFRDIQNIRSSALAKKTKTSKFKLNNLKLYEDLTPDSDEEEEALEAAREKVKKLKQRKDKKKDVNEEQKSVDKKTKAVEKKKLEEKTPDANKEEENKEEKKEDEETVKDGELVGRGPVQNVRVSNVSHHPYQRAPQIPYGCTAQTPMTDISAYTGYGSGYECGNSWSLSPDTTIGSISASTTPDTVLSSDGYGSASPHQISPKDSPFSEISSADTSRVLTPENNELPENLQDFILQYSNQYTREDSIKARPGSADSGVCSPMSARSAPNASPHVPQGTCSGPTTPSFNQTRLSPRSSENGFTAKQRYHAVIPETDLAAGFHWACTNYKDVSRVLDADGDTVLHILTAHTENGKIYGLCETLKRHTNENEENAFNLLNNFGETPIFVAVSQQNVEAVDYFMECGASPNAHSSRANGCTPLHIACAHGMHKMVEVLLSNRETRVNDTNDEGQTPFMLAIKMHGEFDVETHQKINNMAIMQMLLKAGANPTISESTTGRTIVHHAIEKLDPQLIEFLQIVISESDFVEMANIPDFCGLTVLNILCNKHQYPEAKIIKEALYIRLLCSGAPEKGPNGEILLEPKKVTPADLLFS